ncbi:hypothetical protein [Curtobacterium ammoniigenes]|uniref:hypothetical protein n=1 Tax=Curtobacterium ammoniigenes TaxID=395387 RepID=UPI000AFD8732|nr:hypothetical protein [Curtobacterium ammoniigenes]
MKFDVILTNPPFQDTINRKRTPHKLWIDFTLAVFDRLLKDGGSLIQVSPSSFSSPSNVVLSLMEENQTKILRFGTEHHFPEVASTFSDYWIVKQPSLGEPTLVRKGVEHFFVTLDSALTYLPNDLGELAISIHRKVMFSGRSSLPVEWDYVTCHNIRRRDKSPSLVEAPAESHPYPVFHTNNLIWWSSIRQDWASQPKVMWTRSGYTKPFFDDGVLGGTDMAYYVKVTDSAEGQNLAANMNTQLLQYIYRTAKWSGFGNERVFSGLPDLPRDRVLDDREMFELFGLTDEEVAYVGGVLAPRRRKAS